MDYLIKDVTTAFNPICTLQFCKSLYILSELKAPLVQLSVDITKQVSLTECKRQGFDNYVLKEMAGGC